MIRLEDLRGHLRAYYGTQAPPPDVLARLEALADPGRAQPAPARSARRLPLVLAAAAAVLVAVAASRRAAFDPRVMPDPGRLVAELAREVAGHHKLCPEGEGAGTAEEAAARLDRLPFHLRLPARLAAEGFRVVSARTCVLRGEAMAEIRVLAPDGRKGTFCLARLPAGMEPGASERVEVDGLEVEVWSEAGLLVGLAVAT